MLSSPERTTLRKAGLWLLWLGFIIYSLFLAPPVQTDLASLQRLLAGELWLPNPTVIAVFSLIGMWIMIYSSVLFADGRGQKVPAWPFLLASIASGVIGLIPYLALRNPSPGFSGLKDNWLRFWDSRQTAALISLSTLFFLVWGILWGNWSDFVIAWQTSRFIHVMSLAFCLFALLFPTVLGDDLVRRGCKSDRIFWAIALVPLFGPLAYLCLRPSLPDSK